MNRRDFLRTAGGMAGAAAATTAASGSAVAAAENGTTHTVEITDGLAFEPESLTVAPGDTVVFENVGNAGHSVTAYADDIPEEADYWASGGFDDEQAARDGWDANNGGVFYQGESWEHTFETEGVYRYFCTPHRSLGMKGAVVVGEGRLPLRDVLAVSVLAVAHAWYSGWLHKRGFPLGGPTESPISLQS